MMEMSSASLPIQAIIEVLGIVIGIFSAVLVFSAAKNLGGRVGAGIFMFTWGVIFQVAAFTYTLGANYFPSVGSLFGVAYIMPIHQLLMAIGMVFFALSARKFISLGGN